MYTRREVRQASRRRAELLRERIECRWCHYEKPLGEMEMVWDRPTCAACRMTVETAAGAVVLPRQMGVYGSFPGACSTCGSDTVSIDHDNHPPHAWSAHCADCKHEYHTA